MGAYKPPTDGYITSNTDYTDAYFNTYNIVVMAKDNGDGTYTISPSADGLIDKLELCERKGLKALIQLHTDITGQYVWDSSSKTSLLGRNYNVFEDAYSEIDFTAYPALKGFFIADEPSWRQIELFDRVYVPWFNKNFANTDLEFYVNLFGGYSSGIGPMDYFGNINYDEFKYDANGDGDYTDDGEFYYDYPGSGTKYYGDGTAEAKEKLYTSYVELWLSVLEKVEAKNKYFTIDEYPLHDNQAGLINLTEEEKARYIAKGALTADKIFILEQENGEWVVSVDGYSHFVREDWLERTFIGALNAKKSGNTFGAYIQAHDEVGSTNNPETFRLPSTEAEVKWQAYMNIAFGAKRLMYYGYDWGEYGAYITLAKEQTNLYEFVKNTNAELDKVGNVFVAFDTWVGAKTFTPANAEKCAAFELVAEMELASLTGVSSVTTDRELVVGEMIDGNGNHGYMLVGYDDPLNGNATNVSMTFDGADGFIIYRGGERSLSADGLGGTISLTLNAGEGVFVIPVYAN